MDETDYFPPIPLPVRKMEEPLWTYNCVVPKPCPGCVANTKHIEKLEKKILLLRKWMLDFKVQLNDCWTAVNQIRDKQQLP